jgi:hypothetical protein
MSLSETTDIGLNTIEDTTDQDTSLDLQFEGTPNLTIPVRVLSSGDPPASTSSSGNTTTSNQVTTRMSGLTLADIGVTEETLKKTASTTKADVFTREEFTEHFARIVQQATGGQGTAETKGEVMVGLLLYGIENSASSRAPFRGTTQVGSTVVSNAIILGVLGNQVRRFYRFIADPTREYLQKHPELASRVARHLGMPQEHKDLAFDYADYCTLLTTDQQAAIARVFRSAVATASPMGSLPGTERVVGSDAGDASTSSGGSGTVLPIATPRPIRDLR